MKKLSVLIALVLLAVAGTGYAVTCAYDNVPAATLLVPYWKVSLNTPAGPGGVPPFPIPTGGTDTLVSIVNVSTPGVIAHVTVWNKYSKAVIDFNIPLTGKDTVSFSMRDIMNGRLSPNFPQCDLNLPAAQFAACVDKTGAPPKSYPIDPCGLKNPGLNNATYVPSVGFGQTQFIRFSHPDAAGLGVDVLTSISQYNLTTVDAIGAGFRGTVWGSLDESGDVTSFTSSGGANILDKDNPACQWKASAPLGGAALSGYLTIDVVNYCTNFFPDQGDFYDKDAIATAGWTQPRYANFPCTAAAPCAVTYTPNVLIGDVFFVDTATQGGNVSGDPAVAVEFDSRLTFSNANESLNKTFFGKFVEFKAPCDATTTGGCANAGVPPAFHFPGDGREPLGDRYGFRYLADQANGLQSWITVWRSDVYFSPNDDAWDAVNLCEWANPDKDANNGASGSGLYDSVHQVVILTYDNDENLFGGVGVPPGPSGQQPGSSSPNYIFLESQRIDLLAATTAGTGWNPQPFKGGWVDITLRGPGYTGATDSTGFWNQGWVGVQHTAPGAFISVGHAAANLNNQFQCSPNRVDIGTWVDFNSAPAFVRSSTIK